MWLHRIYGYVYMYKCNILSRCSKCKWLNWDDCTKSVWYDVWLITIWLSEHVLMLKLLLINWKANIVHSFFCQCWCLTNEAWYCDVTDYGRNTTFLSPQIALIRMAHRDKCLHQSDRTSKGTCVCVCVLATKLEMKTSDLHWEALLLVQGTKGRERNPCQRKIVWLCLIDLSVIYLVLHENCSHPAQAIFEGLWFALWIHSHLCNSISPQ